MRHSSDVLTSEEAADYLRVSVRTLHRLARAKDVPGTKVGRAWRFRAADLDAYLARERQAHD